MNENSVKLRPDQVERARLLAGSERFPNVAVARSGDEAFAISRDKGQIAAFRAALGSMSSASNVAP